MFALSLAETSESSLYLLVLLVSRRHGTAVHKQACVFSYGTAFVCNTLGNNVTSG